MSRTLALAALALSLPLSAAASAAAVDVSADDLDVMRGRVVAQALVQPQFAAPYDAAVSDALALLSPGGSFTDLDYALQEPATWPAYFHPKRTEYFATALLSPRSTYFNDSGLRAKTLLALDWWLVHGRESKQSNWWWWTIGVPISLGKTVALLDGQLAANQTAAAAAQLALASMAGMTAANLVWTAEGTVYRGLLTRNGTLVAAALAAAFGTIAEAPGPAEGPKADCSFFEHGPQLYNGGYGESYAMGVAMLLSWTAGLPAGLPPGDARWGVFSHLVLDGCARMLTFGAPPPGSGWGVPLWDVSVVGRDVSRPYNSNWGMQSGLQVRARAEVKASSESRGRAHRVACARAIVERRARARVRDR